MTSPPDNNPIAIAVNYLLDHEDPRVRHAGGLFKQVVLMASDYQQVAKHLDHVDEQWLRINMDNLTKIEVLEARIAELEGR